MTNLDKVALFSEIVLIGALIISLMVSMRRR